MTARCYACPLWNTNCARYKQTPSNVLELTYIMFRPPLTVNAIRQNWHRYIGISKPRAAVVLKSSAANTNGIDTSSLCLMCQSALFYSPRIPNFILRNFCNVSTRTVIKKRNCWRYAKGRGKGFHIKAIFYFYNIRHLCCCLRSDRASALP